MFGSVILMCTLIFSSNFLQKEIAFVISSLLYCQRSYSKTGHNSPKAEPIPKTVSSPLWNGRKKENENIKHLYLAVT